MCFLDQIFQDQVGRKILVELPLFSAPAFFAGVVLGWFFRPKFISAYLPSDCKLCLETTPTSSMDDEKKKKEIVGKKSAVTDDDFEHFCKLVEVSDGGPAWKKMLDKSMPTFTYQAWHRDPPNGPPQYRSSTVFENATPEMVRDFFWDDEFRISSRWDDMLLEHKTLEECSETGTMVVQWTRKFPLGCSNREYIIGRRMWSSGNTYYCVTKGVPYASVPRRNKPWRVDLYYSSWCIRPAPSKIDGQMTACEVLLFHHEDMGISWAIARHAISHGMWGCVRRIEPGLRAYQASRSSNEPLSHFASMAQINTKVDVEQLSSVDTVSDSSKITEPEKPKHWSSNVPKFLIIGGVVALACSVDQGLFTKAAIFGAARRFARQGERLR